MSGLARDGTAEPVPRDFRHQRGQGKHYFPHQLTTNRVSNHAEYRPPCCGESGYPDRGVRLFPSADTPRTSKTITAFPLAYTWAASAETFKLFGSAGPREIGDFVLIPVALITPFCLIGANKNKVVTVLVSDKILIVFFCADQSLCTLARPTGH